MCNQWCRCRQLTRITLYLWLWWRERTLSTTPWIKSWSVVLVTWKSLSRYIFSLLGFTHSLQFILEEFNFWSSCHWLLSSCLIFDQVVLNCFSLVSAPEGVRCKFLGGASARTLKTCPSPNPVEFQFASFSVVQIKNLESLSNLLALSQPFSG